MVLRNESTLDSPVINQCTLESALNNELVEKSSSIFVIGGGQIYQDLYTNTSLDKIFLTKVIGDFQCDSYFPKIDLKTDFKLLNEKDTLNLLQLKEYKVKELKQEEKGILYEFNIYQRR